MDISNSPSAPYDEAEADSESILSKASSFVKSMFQRARSVFAPSEEEEPDNTYCGDGDACEDLRYIPEQGSYGSCSVIAVVSLVLKTPCLMDYLKIKNPDAHYALEQIKPTPDNSFVSGQVEDEVCPYLPRSVWRMYFSTTLADYDDLHITQKRQFLINYHKTPRQRFSDPLLKKHFLYGFEIQRFMEALFNGAVDYFPEIKSHRVPMTDEVARKLKMDLPTLSPVPSLLRFKATSWDDLPLYSIENNSLFVSFEFRDYILELCGWLATHMAAQGFYIVPYFIVVGNDYTSNDNEHRLHAFLGNFCNRKNDVTLCSFGVCTSTQKGSKWADRYKNQLGPYVLEYFDLVCVPRDFNPESWG